jgi:hypothetical protein
MLSKRFFFSNTLLILISTWPECRLVRCVPVLDFLHCYCDFVCSTLVKCWETLPCAIDAIFAWKWSFYNTKTMAVQKSYRSTQVKHRQQNALNHKVANRLNVKLIRYQFWCTICAFRLMKSRQWYLVQKVQNTDSQVNRPSQQIWPPVMYLRVVFSFKMAICYSDAPFIF